MMHLLRISAHLLRCHNSGALGLAAAIAILFAVACPPGARAASPAELISSYRHQHGEGKVTSDAALNRIAQEQANAMAATGALDHAAFRPFADRVANLDAERAAENLAINATFAKALEQWIGSYGHRRNLLMHEGTRVGIASAKSKSGETYWAMEIAGPKPERVEHARSGNGKDKPCRLMLNDLCL
jgi:cysteine-rich secretory family protein